VTDIATLTAAEADLLAQAEVTISRGIKAFREVGDALISVRENRLYRAEFDTFEDYCRDRWQLERATAYRAIQSAQVASILSPMGEEIKNERQARELAPLLETPDEMRAAFTEAIARSDGKPTAAVIRDVVRERMDPASPLAQVAERELDKVEQRAAIREANAPMYEPMPAETVAFMDDLHRRISPAVSIRTACDDLLNQVRGVDPERAITEAPDVALPKLTQVRAAIEFLTRVADALQPKEVPA
jgi:hypothetical protein